MSDHPPRQSYFTRRNVLWSATLLTALYPLLRFIGFRVPKKPVYVQVSTPMPARGYLITGDLILFDKNNEVWAFSRKCTHLGCKVNYLEDQDVIQCPCHQSQFSSTNGTPLHGPAKKPLIKFAVEKRASPPFYVITT